MELYPIQFDSDMCCRGYGALSHGKIPPLLLAPGPRPAFGPLRGCPRVKHRGAHGAEAADREEARGVEVEERHGDERAAHDGQCRGEALDNVVGVPSKCR